MDKKAKALIAILIALIVIGMAFVVQSQSYVVYTYPRQSWHVELYTGLHDWVSYQIGVEPAWVTVSDKTYVAFPAELLPAQRTALGSFVNGTKPTEYIIAWEDMTKEQLIAAIKNATGETPVGAYESYVVFAAPYPAGKDKQLTDLFTKGFKVANKTVK